MAIVRLKNKKNGITYLYESESYWDKEKGQPRNKRVCIGKVDLESGETIYNQRYLERHKRVQPGVVASTHYDRRFYGATYLFDAIGEKLGITEDLKASYPEHYQQILSIAYYLILEDRNPLHRFGRWERTHQHPYAQAISSQRSSELFGRVGISEDAKQRFFLHQS